MTIQSLHFGLGLSHSNIRTVVYGLHIPFTLQSTKNVILQKKKKLFHYHTEHSQANFKSAANFKAGILVIIYTTCSSYLILLTSV